MCTIAGRSILCVSRVTRARVPSRRVGADLTAVVGAARSALVNV